MGDSNTFLWGITFLLIFGFLLAIYGIEVELFKTDFEQLSETPNPPETFASIPILGGIEFGAYMAYFGIDKAYIFIIFLFNVMGYGSELTYGIPFIGLTITFVSIVIIFEGVKLIRGTS